MAVASERRAERAGDADGRDGPRRPRGPGCRGGPARVATGFLALAVLLAGTACASGRGGPLGAEPIPYADTLPIPEPDARPDVEAGRIFQEALGTEFVRPFSVRKLAGARHEALNVTHFDGVVPSAWWEPRITAGELSPERVGEGAATGPGPDTSRTLTVVAGKGIGVTPGFTVEDARGDRYLFKFDPEGFLHMASSADVITSRLLWAAGYHVPEEYKVVFDSAKLEIAPEARVLTPQGEKPMTRRDLVAVLESSQPRSDGDYVALASKFLEGTPKGPFYFGGVRKDDPNDHYRHEYRRDLRGLHVVAAWINHYDMRFANTLDVYVEPGYLRHYLIDFGGSLGSGSVRPRTPRGGREYNADIWASTLRLFTGGFYRVGWEGEEAEVIHPSIGWIRTEGFDPGGWKANWPNPAFRSITPADGYWGAKIVARFTDTHIREAVAAGELPNEAAADTLAAILRYRRDRTIEHWYGRVTPVEEVTARGPRPVSAATGEAKGGERAVLRVAFRDLGIASGVWSDTETRYRWRFEHGAVGLGARGVEPARAGAEQEIRVPLERAGEALGGEPPAGRAAVATLEITAIRPRREGREARVWLRLERDPEGGAPAYRVIGLRH